MRYYFCQQVRWLPLIDLIVGDWKPLSPLSDTRVYVLVSRCPSFQVAYHMARSVGLSVQPAGLEGLPKIQAKL